MIAKMMALSFAEYPFVKDFLKDAFGSEEKRMLFLEKASGMLIKTLMRKGICFFERNDGEVRAFCILSTIENMQPTVWDMVAGGAIGLLPSLFNKAIREFIVFYLSEAATVDYPKGKDVWYVHLFAVNPNHQGKGLGSMIMNDCVFPYVDNRQGKSIFLATK
ncbi:MAG: GNAT family N-acetyltransferase [Defluviitaleaceae bacterium]|nr:GNAT family N-acetyltransferase [Defluviitaleaceae bacterium]